MTENLLKGFKEFCADAYDSESDVMGRLVEEGQRPEYFIISCIDSRSNPGTIFRPAPGTFIAYKAMGAIVRPYQQGTALAAALQFAIHHINVRKIILLGHTRCGAINALVDKVDDPDIAGFIDVAQTAFTRAKAQCGPNPEREELLHRIEEQLVILSVENLETYPSVAPLLESGELEIVPWLFELETGTLKEFDGEAGAFAPIPGQAEHKLYRRKAARN
ncbi:MAG: carbonic anhydrase [Alphaproteobacteria bacterium]